MPERLQKIISQAGIASRRGAEELIKEGRVKVNGSIVTELGAKAELRKDTITVDGKPVKREKHVYLLLYKPKGIVTSLHDPDGRKTVTTLLHGIKERVYPVGRLDYNTEGLLLLTNDGALTNALTHPRHEIAKTYQAKVLGRPSEEKLDTLRIGVMLEDGLTAPATLRFLEFDNDKGISLIEIVIHEGRNRQVRRMFDHIGHPVRNLKRIRLAFLTLSGLRRGQYRHLEKEEVEQLKSLAEQHTP